MDIVGRALKKSKREKKSYEKDTLFGVVRDSFENELSLDQEYIKRSDSTYFFRLGSQAMKPLMEENDLLIVDTSLKLFHRAIIVCYLNEKALCRQFLKQEGKLVLHAFNGEDRLLEEEDQFELFGVVTASIRKFI